MATWPKPVAFKSASELQQYALSLGSFPATTSVPGFAFDSAVVVSPAAAAEMWVSSSCWTYIQIVLIWQAAFKSYPPQGIEPCMDTDSARAQGFTWLKVRPKGQPLHGLGATLAMKVDVFSDIWAFTTYVGTYGSGGAMNASRSVAGYSYDMALVVDPNKSKQLWVHRSLLNPFKLPLVWQSAFKSYPPGGIKPAVDPQSGPNAGKYYFRIVANV